MSASICVSDSFCFKLRQINEKKIKKSIKKIIGDIAYFCEVIFFWSGNLFLIAPFPDLCLLVPFSSSVVEHLGFRTLALVQFPK